MQLHIWLSNEGHCPCGFHFYSFYMKIGQVYINAKKRAFTGGISCTIWKRESF